MKYLRVTTTPDPAVMPEAFGVLANAPYVEETRLREWNRTDSRGVTALLEVRGDRAAFEPAIRDAAEVRAADLADAGENRFYLLVTLDPDRAPMLARMSETMTLDGLVIHKPVVYRDGQVHVRLVGEQSAVQGVVETLPPSIDVEIHEIGVVGFDPTSAVADLSDRQREAVLAAIELGYYDTPRRATHEDVADSMGCAPSTVSEHLQRAEGKLVVAMMRSIAPAEMG